MEYDGKGVFNSRGKAIRVEGHVATDTTRVPNSRRVREATSQAKRFAGGWSVGPYRKATGSRKGRKRR